MPDTANFNNISGFSAQNNNSTRFNDTCREHAQTEADLYILSKRVDAHDTELNTIKQELQCYREEVMQGMRDNHEDNNKIYNALLGLSVTLLVVFATGLVGVYFGIL